MAEEVCPVELRDEQLREALAVRCRAERLEPPGQPDRIIGTAWALFEKTFCERITIRLGDDGAARLEALVTAPGSSAGGSGRGLLAKLKADPGQVSLETLLREVDKLAGVKALRLPGGLFADCSERLVEAWRARATRSYPSDLAAAAAPVRLTLLAALCWTRSAEITDALVDLLLGLVHKINARAERRVEKELTEDLRRVRGMSRSRTPIQVRIAAPSSTTMARISVPQVSSSLSRNRRKRIVNGHTVHVIKYANLRSTGASNGFMISF